MTPRLNHPSQSRQDRTITVPVSEDLQGRSEHAAEAPVFCNGPIVCSTDFSVHAGEAADVASWIAARSGQKILLVNAGERRVHAEASQQADDTAAAKLRVETERLSGQGVAVEGRYVEGPVAASINRVARESSAALIVMGSLGAVAPSLLIAASDAEEIAESASCPTLVIHNETRLKDALSGQRPLRILAGHDFSNAADAALRWIGALRKLTPCAVTVVSVAGEAKGLDASEAALKERVNQVLNAPDATCGVVLSPLDPGIALVDVAADEHPDIFVVGTHQKRGLKRFWLGSVSRLVLREAATNVAVVPAAKSSE